MRPRGRGAFWPALLLLAGACAARPPPGPEAGRVHAVLVAGDASLPVWDNAVARLAEGIPAGRLASLRRFSASPDGGERATLPNVTRAIAAMRPGPGESCLIFLTAHGAQGQGLLLVPSRRTLAPAALARALDQGCGQAPTVVVASGCFSGLYANPPIVRQTRVVLTAARADRASFGCGAGFVLTVYDSCLLGALDAAAPGGWEAVAIATDTCVRREEARLQAVPSDPQVRIGAGAARLPVPWRRPGWERPAT